MMSSDVYSIRSSRSEKVAGHNAAQQQATRSGALIRLEGAPGRETNGVQVEDLEHALVDNDGIAARADSSAMLPISRNEILGAVQDLLKSAGMSLDDDVKDVMDSNLALKEQLSQKDARVDALVSEGKVLSKELSKGLDAFLCPITREIMTDPVICADGHTYERHAIDMWLRT
eukprot:CAMPEP_0197460846 /NCGR_PEP_ID=MMETSP1175-20131217/54991_1 /TAXON_ID=1003142 /ORGANISM="Triceratium dubium, Strain CCMP147" /LENGTH=172 /DNA_ID=CAMNT_0042996017 /DNA_START=34 /DNA_END=548 /DNA_ORIENTATION=+